jgi:hypothetical protein
LSPWFSKAPLAYPNTETKMIKKQRSRFSQLSRWVFFQSTTRTRRKMEKTVIKFMILTVITSNCFTVNAFTIIIRSDCETWKNNLKTPWGDWWNIQIVWGEGFTLRRSHDSRHPSGTASIEGLN